MQSINKSIKEERKYNFQHLFDSAFLGSIQNKFQKIALDDFSCWLNILWISYNILSSACLSSTHCPFSPAWTLHHAAYPWALFIPFSHSINPLSLGVIWGFTFKPFVFCTLNTQRYFLLWKSVFFILILYAFISYLKIYINYLLVSLGPEFLFILIYRLVFPTR
jgi:hypothetical protein